MVSGNIFSFLSSLVERLIITFICLCFAWVQLASAENEQKSERSWGMGLGGVSYQRSYKDISDDNLIFPTIMYEDKHIRLIGPSLDVKLPSISRDNSRSKIDYGLKLEYLLSGYDDHDIEDTPVLDGMGERNNSVWFGSGLEWQAWPWSVSAKVMTDVSHNSQGNILSVDIQHLWLLNSKFIVAARVGIMNLSKNYVEYYYGVRAHEVSSSRAAYHGDSALNMQYGTRFSYRHSSRSSIVFDLTFIDLADEIVSSPLVDRSSESKSIISYVYKF